jgi:hypothetical protein
MAVTKQVILPIGIVLVIVVLTITPFNYQIVPVWELRVVDKNGKPIDGIKTRQTWQFYATEFSGHEEDKLTDETGHVRYSARSVTVSLFTMISGSVKNIIQSGIHASFGTYAQIVVWDDKTTVGVTYNSSEALPNILVFDK